MFSKLIVVALISVAVAAPQHHTAAQFPAGVDPSKCPGFPICDNALLHNQQPSASWSTPAPSWNQQPSQSQWEQPQQQWNQQPQQQWNQPEPQQHWNQPQSQPQWNQPQPQQQWNHQQPAAYQAPSNHLSSDEISGAGGDKYPAGVDPKSCPNYPYCDGAASHNAAAPATAAPPLQGYNERQYPAGVSPHSCPNFPYCN
ncbi:uncharacterized protein LOC129906412 [Episyrphus balteatus]|uniref:uncharacterized protein LOC129906412 n=1 Tax=Episyrphus balteatus TaxID=286459 RepID=UPI002485BCBE|nr:uncharacterized protein LOC129906412 [Episyrphus balteatus]